MVNLMPLLKGAALESIVRSLTSPPALPKAGIGLMVLAVLPISIGLGFLSYAEYLALISLYTPAISALLTGLSAFLVAGAIAAFGMIMRHMHKRRHKIHHANINGTIQSLLNAISEELEEPIRENPKTAVLLASLAGFMAGERLPPH